MNELKLLKNDENLISNALKIRFFPITIKSAKGTKVYDYNDKEYIDLTAGWAVSNIGYGNEKVADKIKEQYNKLSFTTQIRAPDRNMDELAQKKDSIFPEDLDK